MQYPQDIYQSVTGGHHSRMDVYETRRERLRTLIADRFEGVQARLATAIDRQADYVSRCLKGTKRIGEEFARHIEKSLGLPDLWLDGSVTTDLKTGYDIEGNGQPETARPYPSGNRIPVVGSALLGDNGHFVELEYPVGHGDGWVDIASRDPNAYALRCRGDSMKPRIQSGEFVVVEPNTEPTPGDEVLVKAVDGRVMVKKYLYRRDGRVHLISVNEAHPSIAIEENNIAAMHYVGAIVKVSRWVTG